MAKRKSRRKRSSSRRSASDTPPASAPDLSAQGVPPPYPPPPPEKPDWRMAAAVVAAFILGAVGMWAYVAFQPSPPLPARKFQLLIPGQVPQNKATAISPDGRTIAYIADGRLWLGVSPT